MPLKKKLWGGPITLPAVYLTPDQKAMLVQRLEDGYRSVPLTFDQVAAVLNVLMPKDYPPVKRLTTGAATLRREPEPAPKPRPKRRRPRRTSTSRTRRPIEPPRVYRVRLPAGEGRRE